MDKKPSLFILVRHGQTEWNRIERFRGRANISLNDNGFLQAKATGKRIARQWMPAAVYSSPLSRALQTAEAIAKHFNLSVMSHDGLIDIDYGKWQGLTPNEAQQLYPEQVDNWFNHPERAIIPIGETLDELRDRAMQTIHELSSRHTGETIVLVSHIVMNRIILLSVLGLGNHRFWHIKQATCAINVFEAQNNDFTLELLNDTCHLRKNLE